MNKLTVLTRLYKEKVLAIIRIESLEQAQKIVDGCLAGGVSCLEISYTNNNAGQIIEGLKAIYGDRILVGAGTILDGETARHAILHGAQFVIAPNFHIEASKTCHRYQIPYMPGCTSMTEIVEALEYGADMIKVFPNSSFIGPKVVSTIKTPMPYVPILSSGGATIENIQEWLSSGVDVIGIGSLLSKGTEEEIAQHATAICKKIHDYQKT